MAIVWDTTILPFHSVMFARRNLSRSGGQTLTGVEQVVQSSIDFWEASVTIKVRKPAQIVAYRALQAQNWGRAGEWLIPVCATGITVDASFSSDFGDDFAIGPPVHFTATADHPVSVGTRNIYFHMDLVEWVPKPGVYFSIGNRLYLLSSVTPTDTAGGYYASFVPSLREAVSASNTLEFATPRCLMRLAQDNIGQLNLDMLRFADVSLNFVEVPT